MSSNASNSRTMAEMLKADDEARLDIWASIQTEKEKKRCALDGEWPTQPLLRRSSSLMSQQSLELCTESLGSETGADGLSSADELEPLFSSFSKPIRSFSSETNRFGDKREEENEKELVRVNRHCSNARASPSPPRPFPPPLSSCSIKIRSTRRDGRLILEAHPTISHNYLHAQRHGGRLLLSFVNPGSQSNSSNILQEEKPLQTEEEYGEEDEVESVEEEDEVERVEGEEKEAQLIDRGSLKDAMVNCAVTVKAFLSSPVINNFAVGTPPAAPNEATPAVTGMELLPTATLADAGVYTSTPDGLPSNYLHLHHLRPRESQTTATAGEEEVEALIAQKRRRRKEVLHDMRPCGDLRRPPINFHVREALLHSYLLASWPETANYHDVFCGGISCTKYYNNA